jgi:hypothetical protein
MEELKNTQEQYDQAARRAAILRRLRESQSRLFEITSAVQKLANTEDRHTNLIKMVAKFVQQETEAKSKLAATAAQMTAAREALRILSADQDRERQLRQTILQKNCAELRSQQAGNEAALSRIRAIEVLAERASAPEAAVGVLSAKIAELTVQHDVAQFIVATLRRQRSPKRRRPLRKSKHGAEQAGQYRNTALQIENSLSNVNLPDISRIDALKRLEQQLDVARAKLGVGLHLDVKPKRELHLSIRRDGGKLERSVLKEAGLSAHATNEIQLDIEDVAEISLSGGSSASPDARIVLA